MITGPLFKWFGSKQVIACEAICPKTGNVPDYLAFTNFRRSVTSRRKVTENHHSSELIYHYPGL